MRPARIPVLIGLAAALAVTPAGAYYHYVHYLQTPFSTPVYEKFDLRQLPSNTLTFFVSDQGPGNYSANDDFASILNQVRQATLVWNGVASSDLRVAFGGVESHDQAANGPGGDVIFTDLAPGVLGMGGVTAADHTVDSPNGPFFPVVRSIVRLSNDASRPPGPSYLESFFTTAVHEMGHALGLQHTFVGAAMSYSLIRNTSRAHPIDLDDIAALSKLYGTAGYGATVGSISGRVTSDGQPVVMASVVAITATGPAISTLSNPDGSYRIDGLLPGHYWVYVHPLPPDANIRGPYDPNGQAIAWSGPFETLFYPGTRDPQQFGTVAVDANSVATGIDFSVGPRSAVPMYDISTYSYSDAQIAAKPALVNFSKGLVTIVAQAFQADTPVPQSVTVLGGFANPRFQAYSSPAALALYLQPPLFTGTGPRHILFNFGNDMYVLPNGLTLVQKDPPAITSVTPNTDGTVTVTGTNFDLDSRVFFDGLPARVTAPLNGDSQQGSITVTPPPGYSGQNANVIVYDLGDEQNSTIYQTQNPPTYAYPAADAPQVNVTPSLLPANVSAMVDITAINMQFVDGQTTLGLGTSDISVRPVRVLSPTHMVANVVVSPGAAIGTSAVSLLSGFQTSFQAGAFQTQAANSSLPQISLPLINNDPNQAILYPGAIVTMWGSNLGASAASVQMTLNDQPVKILFAGPNQINFVVPTTLTTGLATLKLNNGAAVSLPIAVPIDATPPVITVITDTAHQTLDANHSATAGDVVFATVSGVDPSVVGSTGRVTVTVGGAEMPVVDISAGTDKGTVQVAFVAGPSSGGQSAPVAITVDGSRSSPYAIVIQ